MKEILKNLALINCINFCKENNINCDGTYIYKYPRKYTYSLVRNEDGLAIVSVTFYKNRVPYFGLINKILIDAFFEAEEKGSKIDKSILLKNKTFYFMDNENCTMRVTGYDGSPKKFEKEFRVLNDEFTNSEDPEYSEFYEEISKKLNCEIEYVEEKFYQ
jgi:hypothetical protein